MSTEQQERCDSTPAAGTIAPGTSVVRAARDLACRLLAEDAERARHSAAVAARAASLSSAVADHESGVLVAAAWLHDIGYAPRLKDTGFHPLDGARHLRSIGWHPVICDLVAHHSGSRFVAAVNGLDGKLAEFAFEEDPLSDALTIADQTIGPDGRPFSLDERMRDMLRRHGADSPHALAHPARRAYFRAAWARVDRRLGGGRLGGLTTVAAGAPAEESPRGRPTPARRRSSPAPRAWV